MAKSGSFSALCLMRAEAVGQRSWRRQDGRFSGDSQPRFSNSYLILTDFASFPGET
jgi:hypothetical protein